MLAIDIYTGENVAIIQSRKNRIVPEILICAICRISLRLDKATAGLLDANNYQAFACVSHLSEVELLIVGWADFLITERNRYRQNKQNVGRFIYGGGDAPTHS